jgi:type IV secretory pathway VirD2 relaxase
MKDDDVTPKLGRIRAKGGQSYVPRVLGAASRAGGLKSIGRGGGKSQSRGRGAGIASVTAGGRMRGPTARRVVIKARYTELSPNGIRAARAHLRYLQRDGVTTDGRAGELYDRKVDLADGRAFMDRSAEDPRQFRFIVSAEDGDKYEDLKPLIRRFMHQMEADLGTKLDWVAVDHHNTGHPHSHIVVRGLDDAGKDLTIARDYISEGMRDRLQALVTLDLGPRTEREIEQSRALEVAQARFTSLDRHLQRTMSLDRIVEADSVDPKQRRLNTGRLTKLQEFGLAEDLGKGRWHLSENLEPVLRELGERGDIIKSLHRELQWKGMAHAAEDAVIHRVGNMTPADGPLVGQVVKRGLLDGDGVRHFIVLDGVDGHAHWIDIGLATRTKPLDDNALVQIDYKRAEIRSADHTIVAVAQANGGRYDVAAHLNYDQTATEAFAETHMRRLEAIRRLTGMVERTDEGSFIVGDAYMDKALAYEEKRRRQAPVEVKVLSRISLDRLTAYNGATWLDRELVEPTAPLSEAGFGGKVTAAIQMRRAWLLQQDLAVEMGSVFHIKPDALQDLVRRDLDHAGERLGKQSGLPYAPSAVGDRVAGQLRRAVDLPSGKYAMIENAKEFTLVPWRPVLEDHIGKTVTGVYREEGINWSIGRTGGRGIQ